MFGTFTRTIRTARRRVLKRAARSNHIVSFGEHPYVGIDAPDLFRNQSIPNGTERSGTRHIPGCESHCLRRGWLTFRISRGAQRLARRRLHA